MTTEAGGAGEADRPIRTPLGAGPGTGARRRTGTSGADGTGGTEPGGSAGAVAGATGVGGANDICTADTADTANTADSDSGETAVAADTADAIDTTDPIDAIESSDTADAAEGTAGPDGGSRRESATRTAGGSPTRIGGTGTGVSLTGTGTRGSLTGTGGAGTPPGAGQPPGVVPRPPAPGGLATGVEVLLGATAVAAVLEAIAAGAVYRVCGGYLDLVEVVQLPDRLDQAVALRTATRALYWCVFLVCAPVFLAWFRRARLAAPGPHRHAPAWAVTGWFLPGVWWLLPRRIALDVVGGRADRTAAGAVDVWWACWTGFSAASLEYAVVSLWADPHSVPQLRGSAMAEMAAAALGVAAAVAAIVFVRQADPGPQRGARHEPPAAGRPGRGRPGGPAGSAEDAGVAE